MSAVVDVVVAAAVAVNGSRTVCRRGFVGAIVRHVEGNE